MIKIDHKPLKYQYRKFGWLCFIFVIYLMMSMKTSTTGLSQSNSEPKTSSAKQMQAIETGAFVGVSPPTASGVREFENLIDKHIYTVMWYQGWDTINQPSFPTTELENVRDHDGYDTQIILQLTWEPWVSLQEINNGDYDAYLTSYAEDVKNWNDTVRIRFAHEMIQDDVLNNQEWYPWQDQPMDYINAFSHVHNIFETTGATNVEFVWCPNNYPFDLNIVQKYYPGNHYVDWLCMDGYNWTNQDGTSAWPNWQWFDDIFYNIYHTLTDNSEVFGAKPLMIGEFGSCEAGIYDQSGQTKDQWIENAFERIKSQDYSKIQGFYWFNINKKGEGSWECDWRVNSSNEALMEFKIAVRDPVFSSHKMPALFLPVVMK